MKEDTDRITWAPRVRREKVFRLYAQVAKGILDEELIDDVAYSILVRCEDIMRICEQRYACPRCQEELPSPHPFGKDLKCPACPWAAPWQAYFKTFKGKQLSVASDAPWTFASSLPRCRTASDKLILIDKLIHECHKGLKRQNGEQLYTRPVAANTLDCTLEEAVAFLENLPYGPCSLPGMSVNLSEWREKCFSSMDSMEEERSAVQGLVDAMPHQLRRTVEDMISAEHRQRARERLSKIPEYSGSLESLRGGVAHQMVRVIDKEMKGRSSPTRSNDGNLHHREVSTLRSRTR